MDIRLFGKSPIGSLVPLRGIDSRRGVEYDHSAFGPAPLSSEPELSGRTWHDVVAAHQAVARLDQAGSQVLDAILSREVQSASALEGTVVPLEDVLGIDDEGEVQASDRDLLEVVNYRFAANNAYELIQRSGSVTVGLLCEIHQRVVRGTNSESRDAEQIRTIPVVIGSPYGTIEEARFVPMPPGTGLHAELNSLVDWMNTESDCDAIIASAMVHYQFETLHLFNDGNGRIGRLLVVLQLVSATGDWDPWVRFLPGEFRSLGGTRSLVSIDFWLFVTKAHVL